MNQYWEQVKDFPSHIELQTLLKKDFPLDENYWNRHGSTQVLRWIYIPYYKKLGLMGSEELISKQILIIPCTSQVESLLILNNIPYTISESREI